MARRHHAFQRLLRTVAVVNHYEGLLTYGDDRLVFRRDNPKYLHLILIVTFLHQLQRTVKHDAEIGVDYVETTLGDIAIANELAVELFGSGLDELSRPSRELLERVADFVRAKAAATKTAAERVEFARRELREVIGWSEYQLRTHLRELVELEYVVPLGGRHGALFTYRLAWTPEAGERFVPGLKGVEQVRREAALMGLGDGCSDPLPSRRKPNFVRLKVTSRALRATEPTTLRRGQLLPSSRLRGGAVNFGALRPRAW